MLVHAPRIRPVVDGFTVVTYKRLDVCKNCAVEQNANKSVGVTKGDEGCWHRLSNFVVSKTTPLFRESSGFATSHLGMGKACA